MSAKYAGVELCQTTPEVRAWVEKNISLSEFREFHYPTPPAIFSGLTYFPHLEDNAPLRLNVLRWPSGASRWATYHFLATDEQLVDIRHACYGDETEDPPEPIITSPQKLILHGSLDTVTASEMWLLAPRPLSATPSWLPGVNRLWCCTLVDRRYFWNQDHTGNVSEEDAGSWDAFFEVLRTRTGLATNAWDCPSVDSEWLFPHADLQDMNSLPLGLVLDAIAWNVGRKISVDLEKSSEAYPPVVRIRDHTWHNTRLQTNLTNSNWFRLAGGELDLAARDLSSILPEKIRLTVANGEEAREETDLTVNTVTGYETQNGVGTVVFHDRLDSSDASDAQQTALLGKVAAAWLGFQSLATHDVAYAGLVNWLPEAMSDYIEWCEKLDEGSDLIPDAADGKLRKRVTNESIARTRAVRGPFNLLADDLWHGGSGTGSGSGTTPGTNTLDCGDGSPPRTFTITRVNGSYQVEVAPEEE